VEGRDFEPPFRCPYPRSSVVVIGWVRKPPTAAVTEMILILVVWLFSGSMHHVSALFGAKDTPRNMQHRCPHYIQPAGSSLGVFAVLGQLCCSRMSSMLASSQGKPVPDVEVRLPAHHMYVLIQGTS